MKTRAAVLFQIGKPLRLEKYGSGYIRVRKELERYPGMGFSYQEVGDGFMVELSHTELSRETVGPQSARKPSTFQRLSQELPAATDGKSSERLADLVEETIAAHGGKYS